MGQWYLFPAPEIKNYQGLTAVWERRHLK